MRDAGHVYHFGDWWWGHFRDLVIGDYPKKAYGDGDQDPVVIGETWKFDVVIGEKEMLGDWWLVTNSCIMVKYHFLVIYISWK